MIYLFKNRDDSMNKKKVSKNVKRRLTLLGPIFIGVFIVIEKDVVIGVRKETQRQSDRDKDRDIEVRKETQRQSDRDRDRDRDRKRDMDRDMERGRDWD